MRHFLLYLAFSLFRLGVALTPRRLSLAVAGVLGDGAYLLGGETRRAAQRRIADVLGYDGARALRTAREMYRHFGWDLVDLLVFSGWRRRSFPRYAKAEGFEHVTRAMAAGRGVVGLTAHICVWELFGGWVASQLGGIAVLAHPAYDERFNRLLVAARARLGVRTIYRQEPAAVPLGWLRDGGFLGVLADQDIPDMPWVVVDFLGRPARTPVGPALLARRAGAPLIPMYIYRTADLNYRVVVEPPLEKAASKNVKAAVTEDTAAWSASVARWVRSHAEQWVWVHDRWWRGGDDAPGEISNNGVP